MGRHDRAHRRLFQTCGARVWRRKRQKFSICSARSAAANPRSAERLKELMERTADLCLEGRQADQPGIRESARVCSAPPILAALLEDKYGIERHRLTGVMSPWAVKRLDEFGGEHFQIRSGAALILQSLRQIAVSRPNPATTTIRTFLPLVGKVDIRKLEHFSQNDPDA